MKAEGYQFPALKESDAMFRADTAPAWADGEVCHRCRVTFSMVQRKHHCRACGQVFCNQCSSKVSTLPRFGIEKEVRVCEACYEQVNKLVEFYVLFSIMWRDLFRYFLNVATFQAFYGTNQRYRATGGIHQ